MRDNRITLAILCARERVGRKFSDYKIRQVYLALFITCAQLALLFFRRLKRMISLPAAVKGKKFYRNLTRLLSARLYTGILPSEGCYLCAR